MMRKTIKVSEKLFTAICISLLEVRPIRRSSGFVRKAECFLFMRTFIRRVDLNDFDIKK